MKGAKSSLVRDVAIVITLLVVSAVGMLVTSAFALDFGDNGGGSGAAAVAPTTERIYEIFTSSDNAGGAETTNYSGTIPGGTLATDGDALLIRAGGTFNATATGDKQIFLKLGGQTIFDSTLIGSTANGDWRISAECYRTGASAQKCAVGFVITEDGGTSSAQATRYATATVTLASDAFLVLSSSGTDAAGITAQFLTATYEAGL